MLELVLPHTHVLMLLVACPNALMAHLIAPVCSAFLALLNHSFAGSSARGFCNFQDEPSQHSRGDQSFDLSCYSLLVVCFWVCLFVVDSE